MKPVKLSTPDSFRPTLERIDRLAADLEMSRSELVCMLLESLFTEDMDVIHAIKVLEAKGSKI